MCSQRVQESNISDDADRLFATHRPSTEEPQMPNSDVSSRSQLIRQASMILKISFIFLIEKSPHTVRIHSITDASLSRYRFEKCVASSVEPYG